MIKLLARCFIKDYKNYDNQEVRKAYGMLAGIVGIILNFFLFVSKLLAGIFSRSVAITADAFNNISDATASCVTLLGFKLSSRKPDAKHPFGHGRIEYIAGLVVAFIIIIMGWELFKNSLNAIINPEPVEASVITIVILSVSILVKFYMFIYNHFLGKKIKSTVLSVTAKDSLNDTVSTFVVLGVNITLFVCKNMNQPVGFPLDGIAGIIVSIFIVKSGIEAVMEASSPLLGAASDREFVEEVEKTVMSHKMIHGIHDFIVHDYGPGRLMISLHAEVPGHFDIFDIHDEIDLIEEEISRKFKCHCIIHMDPVDLQNEEIQVIKSFIMEKAKKIDEGISIHDLRIVPGNTHTNVIFDAVCPHGCKISDSDLEVLFKKIVKEYKADYNGVVKVEKPFV